MNQYTMLRYGTVCIHYHNVMVWCVHVHVHVRVNVQRVHFCYFYCFRSAVVNVIHWQVHLRSLV